MKQFLARLFGRAAPTLYEARPRDAAAIAALHGQSFRRGWGKGEIGGLLAERAVLCHCARIGHRFAGFILSRIAADEAEILSVAVVAKRRGSGLGRALLDLHLRRLAGLGAQAVFLEVDEQNVAARRLYARAGFQEVGRREGYYRDAAGKAATALVLRRDLS